MKDACVYEIPHSVLMSAVLGVSVVNKLPGIQFFSFPTTCPTLSSPDSLEILAVIGKPQQVVGYAALDDHTV